MRTVCRAACNPALSGSVQAVTGCARADDGPTKEMASKYLPTTRDQKAAQSYQAKKARQEPGLKKFVGARTKLPRKKA